MRIAVVGSGISGLSAAWLLNRNGHSVTLFEKETKAGGHTDTDASGPVPVDLGFQVFNLTTYPHLVGFLEQLGVDTEPSDMSFGLSLDQGQLEWASHGLNAIFAQRKNLLEPQFWSMIYHVIRFGREAPEVLHPKNAETYDAMTLGKYVELKGYGAYFKKFYLLPMCAAVWSVPFETVLQFPVKTLVQFWLNHHLLDLFQRPVWRVVKGRSVEYVTRVLKDIKDVRLGCPVVSVTTQGNRVLVTTATMEEELFDAVVMATHSDVTLKLLGSSATEEEQRILSAIPYQKNTVYLHSDRSLMPKLKSTWASWNFVASSKDQHTPICVTYWLNRLQNLDSSLPSLFVTLNPTNGLPDPETIFAKKIYEHPVFSLAGVDAQNRLGSIQGQRGIYYAGAWCGYGFHEDGIRSSVAVAQLLGCSIPWTPRTSSPKLSLTDSFWLKIFDAFARRGIQRGSLRCILPNGTELSYGDGRTEPVVEEAWRGAPRMKATLRILRMDMFRKVVFKTDTGLAEAYMDEDYTVDNIAGLLSIMAVNAASLTEHTKSLGIWGMCGQWLLRLAKSRRANSIEGSKRNIRQHYDIGNAYYKLFLDETMTYSCGMYTPSSSLEEAQLRKLDAAVDHLEIKGTDHVLEIGCGWGSFAIRAVQRTGCRVTGLTLSQEQLREGQERIKAVGLSDRIELLFCDYRHCRGYNTFDKIVSIEMIEAVGFEYLDIYFSVIGRLLKPGGSVFLQAITVPDERYAAYCASSDFIREFVFPGGHLTCMQAINSYAAKYGMSIERAMDIGPDYAVTLRQWRQNWVVNTQALLEAGCNPRLHRMYEIYFAYCEAGFDAQYIQTYQITLCKENRPDASLSTEVCPTADHWTQALLALYFFLAGVLVTQRPYMWLAPIASSISVLVFALTMHVSSSFAFYRRLTHKEKNRWSTQVVHCGFGFSIAAMASAHLLFYGVHASVNENGPWSLLLYCSPVCVTLGFYGFQVWSMVYYRLYMSSLLTLGRYTLLLVLFGIAAYKVELVGYLSVVLLREWYTFVRRLCQLLLLSAPTRIAPVRRILFVTEKATFLLCKCVILLARNTYLVVEPTTASGTPLIKWTVNSMVLVGFLCSGIEFVRYLTSGRFLSFAVSKDHKH